MAVQTRLLMEDACLQLAFKDSGMEREWTVSRGKWRVRERGREKGPPYRTDLA